MIASLDDLSQTGKRTFVHVMCVDGNTFELPATDDIDVGRFMADIKARGFLGTPNWYVVYDAILWACKIQYGAAEPSPVQGMVRQ